MKNIKLGEFDTALTELFSEFVGASRAARQKALTAGAEVAVERLKVASPKKSGKFASNWKIRKYTDIQAVHNSTTVTVGGRSGVPLINVLEYRQGSPYYGFVRRTAQAIEGEVHNAISKKLEELHNE